MLKFQNVNSSIFKYLKSLFERLIYLKLLNCWSKQHVIKIWITHNFNRPLLKKSWFIQIQFTENIFFWYWLKEKKWSHFDLNCWVTCGTKNSTRDSELLVNIWVKLTLYWESIWLKYSPITRNPGSNFSSASNSTFKVKMTPLFFFFFFGIVF